MKNDSIGNLTLRLGIIALCAGLILGLVNHVTAGPIQEQVIQQETKARTSVLEEATDFEEMPVKGDEEFKEVSSVYKGIVGSETVGYTITLDTQAFSPNLKLTVGIDTEGVVTGVTVDSHEETPGLGDNATKPEFLAQFEHVDGPYVVVKAPTGAKGEVNAITGATITTEGIKAAVQLARDYGSTYLLEGV